MTKKTKKDYETVEKTIEYIECDVPGCYNTDKEKELIELAVNPRYESQTWREPTVIEQVDDLAEAKEWVSKERTMNKGVPPIQYGNDNLTYAYGYMYREKIKKAKSDATFHVCQHCLKNHFEAVPDRYNPNNITEINAENGAIVIKMNKDFTDRITIPIILLLSFTLIVVLFLI